MKGYYSLIQYADNPDRFEFINIGVAIFVAEGDERVYSKFDDSARRINKVFGVSLGEHYGVLVESIRSRIADEFFRWEDPSQLELFVLNRSGQVRFTPLRTALFNDPQQDVEHLYDQLVSTAGIGQRRRRVDYKLKELFQLEQVERLLDRPEKIQIRTFSLQPDYGFQNSAYNYIKAVSLHGEPDVALERVSEYAIKGRLLAAEHPVIVTESRPLVGHQRLIVVGDNTEQLPEVVEEIKAVLSNHSVGFFPLDNAYPLIDDIKKNYELHGPH